jgi:hypothetical protein
MKFAPTAATLFAALLLAACGGGAGTTTVDNPSTASCDPNDPATIDECGTVYVGLTDADGDFVNYTVDVVSLTLETANGRVVETLPRRTRINFTDYVDVSELLAARAVPPATYVSGTITLDYTDAEVFVEANGVAKEAEVKDTSGATLTQTDLKITLSERDQLRVDRGRIAFLQLDFDLEASHRVNIDVTPAEAISDQLIYAEVTPVDEKDIRVRGPLASVNIEEMHYVVALRPFFDRAGDFGRARVHVTDDTEFEVDGEMFTGSEGLRALDAAGRGTPTVAAGTLNVADREFTADIVLAGSSVPGSDRDAVRGSVIARNGNLLTIRGATIIPSDARLSARPNDRPFHFHDDVVVEIGPETKVFKDGHPLSDLSIDAISVGQRVTIRGSQPSPSTDALAPQIRFDATQGAVRMHVTHVSGIVNAVMTGQTDITLQAIDRRRVSVFDFSGTGQSPEQDADPANYEIATGNLTLDSLAEGRPIVARGFPAGFGMAPPDFTGWTVIDYTDVRSALGVGWGAAGTVAPFLMIDRTGLLLDNQNPDIDARHYIKQGPVLIDLTALDTNTLIAPRETGRMLFSIKSRDSLRLYSDFDDFVSDLTLSLDGATTARAMYARGKYDVDGNIFTSYKVGIFLLEP